MLHNIQNTRICIGKKPIVSVTYENGRISIKNSLPYLKCVLRLSCVVHGPIYGRFMGFYVNRFLSIIKVYQSWLVGHSSEAARLIHRRKTAVNPLQLLQSPPNSALVTHDIVLLSSRYLYIERKPFT